MLVFVEIKLNNSFHYVIFVRSIFISRFSKRFILYSIAQCMSNFGMSVAQRGVVFAFIKDHPHNESVSPEVVLSGGGCY